MQSIPQENHTEKLNEVREKLAEQLSAALDDRKLTKLDTRAGELRLISQRANAGSYQLLTLDDSGDLESSIGYDHYAYGDFNHHITGPSSAEVLYLIESWDVLVEAFNEYDQQVQDALEKADSLTAIQGGTQ